MTTTIRATGRPAATFPRRSLFKSLIDRLIEADRRYREARKLRQMPDLRLRDMGLTRKEADRAFLSGRW